jgi:hypothetical protein
MDSSGAVLPGVTIRIKNIDTNQARETVSNESGSYFIPLLPVGHYEVSAELPGFKTDVKTGLELQVDQRLNVGFKLEVGQISEKLTVSEAAPLVQADSATVGDVVDTQKMVELPLNGRLFSQVALLTPSATTLAAGNLMARPERDAFVVAGLPNTANYYMIDGIDNNDISVNIEAVKPSIDAIQEYKMQSGTYSAEFGHGGGAQVNIITKAGTNAYHGTVYEFLRNSKLDARNYFDLPSRPIPQFQRNQWGGTFGGPIIKDKMFFFVSDEELNMRQGQTMGATTIPTSAWLAGDFSGQSVIIKDPLNGNQPFPGNKIPGNRFDPSGLAIANLFPLANTSSGTINFISSPPDALTWHQPSGRVDYTISSKDSLFLRVNKNHLQTNIAFDPGSSPFPGYGDNKREIATNIGIVETHIISPTLINEARLGYNFYREEQPNASAGFDATQELLGINGTSRNPRDFAYPYFSVKGLSNLGDRTASPQDRKVPNFQAFDAITWIHKNHNIKSGFEWHRIQNNFFWDSLSRGSFNFTGQYTGLGFADLLLGYVAQTSLNLGDTQRYFRQTNVDAFVQDDWKMNQKVTLNLGVRYEINTPIVEKFNKIASFNAKTGQIDIAGQNGVPRGIYPTAYKNFGPRTGLAYDITEDGKTIFRIGYGIYFDQAQDWTNILTGSAGGYPFDYSYVFNGSATIPDLTMRNPFPSNSGNASISLFSESRDYRTTYVQQYSAGVQRQVARNLVVELSFLGNKQTAGNITRPINAPSPGPGTAAQVNARRPFPQYGNLSQNQSTGNADYNSGILRIEKRFSGGLTFLGSYTWSKSIWDQTTPDPSNTRMGRGPSPIDNRHRVVFSYLYELPFLKNNGYLGGWQISGVVTLRSGQPLTPTLTADNSNTTARQDRPLAIGNPAIDNPDPRVGWWNRSAFTTPPIYTYGNAGTGILVGPAFNNVDFSTSKNFRVTEGTRLQFRGEIFNILNHPNFGQPNTQWDTALFGTVGSALPSRQIQFGLKLVF